MGRIKEVETEDPLPAAKERVQGSQPHPAREGAEFHLLWRLVWEGGGRVVDGGSGKGFGGDAFVGTSKDWLTWGLDFASKAQRWIKGMEVEGHGDMSSVWLKLLFSGLYQMPGMVLSSSYLLTHLISTVTQGRYYHCLHFTDEEIDIKEFFSCPRPCCRRANIRPS